LRASLTVARSPMSHLRASLTLTRSPVSSDARQSTLMDESTKLVCVSIKAHGCIDEARTRVHEAQ
jgi:hypothetical protein